MAFVPHLEASRQPAKPDTCLFPGAMRGRSFAPATFATEQNVRLIFAKQADRFFDYSLRLSLSIVIIGLLATDFS